MHSLAFNFVLSDYLKNKNVTTDVGIVRIRLQYFLVVACLTVDLSYIIDAIIDAFAAFQTGAEYLSKEKGQLGVAPHYFSRSLYAQYCFDAMLTLAYALNQTLAGNV